MKKQIWLTYEERDLVRDALTFYSVCLAKESNFDEPSHRMAAKYVRRRIAELITRFAEDDAKETK